MGSADWIGGPPESLGGVRSPWTLGEQARLTSLFLIEDRADTGLYDIVPLSVLTNDVVSHPEKVKTERTGGWAGGRGPRAGLP